MQQTPKKFRKPIPKKGIDKFFRFSALGTQMFGIILVFTYAGMKLNEYMQCKKHYYTAALALVGVILALGVVMKEVIDYKQDIDDDPPADISQ
ncbi:MAG: AtpZ/AtpI family protein [Sphingobacteriales bacterium]|nr:AtpZ/AtpI family protein [Sphingobacteriales bacterium]